MSRTQTIYVLIQSQTGVLSGIMIERPVAFYEDAMDAQKAGTELRQRAAKGTDYYIGSRELVLKRDLK